MEEIIELTHIKELLESKQYTTLRQTLSEMNEADIATAFEDLEEAEQSKLFRILPKDMTAVQKWQEPGANTEPSFFA